MLSAISFGVFCRSAPSTSAIIRSRKVEPCAAVMRTLIQSERTIVPPVTAERSPPALANDRCGFASDRRFVDRGDAFDHIAVTRNEIAGLDKNDVPGFQIDRGHALDDVLHPTLAIRIDQPFRPRVGTRLAQGCRLRLAAAFGHGLGEIRETAR